MDKAVAKSIEFQPQSCYLHCVILDSFINLSGVLNPFHEISIFFLAHSVLCYSFSYAIKVWLVLLALNGGKWG